MNWDAIDAIGEIAGDIAVFATLFYLGAQIRQSSQNIKAASFQSASQGRTSLRNALATDSELVHRYRQGLVAPDSMSPEDLLHFHILMLEEFRIAQSAFLLHKRNLAEHGFWSHEQHMISTYKATPGFPAWWERSQAFYAAEFVQEVELIEPVPYSDIACFFEKSNEVSNE